MRIELDEDACMGYANCVVEAPELFDIEDDTGKAVVLDAEPQEPLHDAAQEAVRVCPAVAIRLLE